MKTNFPKLKPAVLLPLIAAVLTVFITMPACSRHEETPRPPDLAVTNVILGKPAFPFDPAQTVSLSIAKADPISGETWSARVEKVATAAGDPATWQIVSFSGDSQLSDRIANRAWILHFLETLTTFRADSQLGETDLSHYGFSPPRYSIEWRTAAEGKTTTYELKVGAPVDFEKNPDGETFAVFPPHEEIYQAGGAALVMLRYLKTFSSLRLETLSTLDSAEITEIDVSGKRKLHSKFNGKKWVGADVSALVPVLTHLRIERFFDRPQGQAFSPTLTIRLTDRYSHITTLTFDDQDIAQNSDRGSNRFQLYAGSVSKLLKN